MFLFDFYVASTFNNAGTLMENCESMNMSSAFNNVCAPHGNVDSV